MKLIHAGLLVSGLLLMGQQPCGSETDADGDGYLPSEGDCDDANSSVYPGAPESCDGIDNDCDANTGDICPVPGLQLETKAAFAAITGQDNGRVEPASYDLREQTNALDLFTPSFNEALEYVGSSIAVFATQDEDVIEVSLEASASAQDDYGYGKGSASSEARDTVRFSVLQPLPVQLRSVISNAVCADGGTLRQFLTLTDSNGRMLYFADQPSDDLWVSELPPGQYQLDAYAWTTVSLSGGGDAYPCARANVYAFFERLY